LSRSHTMLSSSTIITFFCRFILAPPRSVEP
jgi:hypothetical protein